MGTLKGFAVRVRSLLRRSATNRDLDEEIRFHIEQETAKNEALGMSPSEARRKAFVAFGGVCHYQEEHADARGARWAEDLAADTRFALRAVRRSPGIAGAAIVTLALGIGANAAIFSAVNAVILQPLPFAAPERLVMVWEENPEKGWYENVAAPANMLDWKERTKAFQDVAAYVPWLGASTLTGDGPPQRFATTDVTGNLFSLLGVRAQYGRTFTDQETWQSTGTPIVVVSHRFWRDHLKADPSAVGTTLQIDGRGVQVVGVMPETFAFPDEKNDLWFPVAWDPASRTRVFFRRAHWLRVIARLAPGATVEQANAQLQAVANRLKTEYPATNRVMGAGLTPLQEFLIGDTRQPLLILLGAVGLLLLIACANVGNLMLVQAAEREREVTVRLALGAGRSRIVRQAITESLVLSALGGMAGVALGWAGTRAVVAMQPEGMLRVRDFGIEPAVLAYVVAITTISGLLFGLAPALWNGRRMPAEALREGGRSGIGGRRMRRWGNGLVVAEVALTLLLTVGAGLLVRSFWQLTHVDPGFDPSGVLTVSLQLPGAKYDTGDKVRAFYDALLERTQAVPRVERAAITMMLPLTGTGWTSDFTAAGRGPTEYGTEVAHRVVTPGYFQTMRVPILRGRPLTDGDRRGTGLVVVINDALARSYFKGQDPIGQRITFDKVPDSTSNWYTIVGVARSEHQSSLGITPQIELYQAFAQGANPSMHLVVRTTTDPASLAPPIRRIIGELDPALGIGEVRTMDTIRADSLKRQRFLMSLLITFAVVGLVLAVVGVYGVLAQLARQRTREMGIRIALGAQGSDVRWLVVRHGLRLTITGLVIGGGVALMATRAMQGLLFEVPSTDPITFAGVALLLAATSIVASWLPANRASRADPATALRGD
jgi:putative ABC transport system permease protein